MTITVIELRAAILLGLWFVWQLFQGLISLGLSSQVNVAFFAHIGGFVAGLAIAGLWSVLAAGKPNAVTIRTAIAFVFVVVELAAVLLVSPI